MSDSEYRTWTGASVVVATCLGYGLFHAWRQTVRTRALAVAARAAGLAFEDAGDPADFAGEGGFPANRPSRVGRAPKWRPSRREGQGALPLFSRGRNPAVTGLAHGMVGEATVVAFDYSYDDGRAQNSRQSVICVRHAGEPLPAFVLRPAGIVEWLTGWGTDRHLQPAFTRQYRLTGMDPEAVRRMFAGPVGEFFTAHPGLTVEGAGDRLIVYRPDRLTPPDPMAAAFVEAAAIGAILNDS